MILLDDFAKCALTGLCADNLYSGTHEALAVESYNASIAMIKARKEALK